MLEDVQAVADFYATRRGEVVAALLRSRLQALWPDLSRQSLLGLGHTTPFLPLWREQARHCIDARPAHALARSEPQSRPEAVCLVQDDALPFPDETFDRVLMVHAIENAAHANNTLRAAWRTLRDDGKLLIVVPNRTGLWAHSETTPFADGAPCSTGRIERMLARSLFRVERIKGALYGPPADLRPVLKAGRVLEAAGRFVTPRLAGVLVVEAVKDLYAALPVQAIPAVAPRRRVLVGLGAAATRQAATLQAAALQGGALQGGALQADGVMPCSSSRSK